MKEQVKDETPENLNGKFNSANSKIDAIKELIFGENIQAYNSEFEALKADIIAKKEELQNLMSAVESEILQNIDTLSTDINIRISDLEKSVEDKLDNLDDKKVNRKLLSELFIKLGEKISD
ncbi:fructose 1,6-bisphosphatase [Algibacter amylolyticus]|uniref:Fructose 1,6-bisphosphatase n=1 Tax=Algibacter amylolyticus TaxID=1608400 RepID=A0A5M7B3V2_9FLAO|nr:fructose 1,6-bisphosphatase [Algibacter amylolyticus]KAA5824069.1 fructose 1,6-bisphosphatase [Algibacter amylolyticus]MBB5269625.1 gas vesicle protein [Algibacter amylolyticus]TSJ74546.1 fructose 1,6-bisphosphatase [Algibacter amylolyticus]